MMKKIFSGLAVILLFSLQGFAQEQAGRKVLVIIGSSIEDPTYFDFGISHVIELKRAGLDVTVIFEKEAVLYFLDAPSLSAQVHTHAGNRFRTAPPTPPVVVASTADVVAIEASKKLAAAAVAENSYDSGKDFKLQFRGQSRTSEDIISSLIKDFKDLHIPYTLCSLSATVFGKYDQLKALGEPLSPNQGDTIDLSPYFKDNYQVLTF